MKLCEYDNQMNTNCDYGLLCEYASHLNTDSDNGKL